LRHCQNKRMGRRWQRRQQRPRRKLKCKLKCKRERRRRARVTPTRHPCGCLADGENPRSLAKLLWPSEKTVTVALTLRRMATTIKRVVSCTTFQLIGPRLPSPPAMAAHRSHLLVSGRARLPSSRPPRPRPPLRLPGDARAPRPSLCAPTRPSPLTRPLKATTAKAATEATEAAPLERGPKSQGPPCGGTEARKTMTFGSPRNATTSLVWSRLNDPLTRAKMRSPWGTFPKQHPQSSKTTKIKSQSTRPRMRPTTKRFCR
jgi:hypothetical protein